jgi:hypothetical protein
MGRARRFAPGLSGESSCGCRYVTLWTLIVFFVTRVAAFLELAAVFLAAGFFGETFFCATSFTSSNPNRYACDYGVPRLRSGTCRTSPVG